MEESKKWWIRFATKGSAELDGKGRYMKVGEALVGAVGWFTGPKGRW